MRSAVFLGMFCLCASAVTYAQPFDRQVYAMPVSAGGAAVEHPFTGGLFNPIHQFVDIDGDADLDLFTFDGNDLSVSFYRNVGTAQVPLFRLETFPMPPIGGWFRLTDVTGDGKLDLLTAGDSSNSLAIYRNTGTVQVPQFTLLNDAVRDSANHLVYVQVQCIPAFADIDGDGDLDFFSLNPGIGTINYYQNIGSAADFLLAFRTDFYQNIQICPGCRPGLARVEHGQGTMYFADIDADNDYDMFYGDLFDPGVFFYQNVGTPAIAILDSVSDRFPPGNPIVTAGFPQPTLADIDGDGDLDLFVSVLPSFQQYDNFYFYRNTGTPANFNFTLITKNFINTLDFGIQSAPAFCDIDADGDKDMVVGDLFGHVALLRNTGTAGAPAFSYEDTSYIATDSNYSYIPAAVDIDADLDLDLVLGNFAGRLEFYRNTGTPSSPDFQRESSFFGSVAVPNYAAPAFFDIDNDGDFDLFVGRSDGRMAFYRNNGTAQAWAFNLVTSSFMNINVGPNSKPAFADIDRDGRKDLVIGASNGKLHYYHNDGPVGNPAFSFVTNSFGGLGTLQEVVPAFVDIDNDGDEDLFVGHLRGGLEFYRNMFFSSAVDDPPPGVPATARLFQNFPNPFNPATTIVYRVDAREAVTLKVFDLLGREVATIVNEVKAPGTYDVRWNADGQPGGVYFYRLTAGHFVETMKLLLIK